LVGNPSHGNAPEADVYRIREAFTNPARKDGLVLKHWWKGTVPLRVDTPASQSHGGPATPAESKQENDSETKPGSAIQTNYPFARFNTKPNVPEYDDSRYETHLTHNDWTKEETDYLMGLARDFDLRWVLIWDRYDFQPKANDQGEENGSSAPQPAPKQRSMEDLKARYYHVAAKLMELTHPLSSMSTAEFDIHEKMSKFDPHRETTRKKLAEALLARSPEELREEEILLGELKRIVDNEERFLEERKDLYRRLDFPMSHGSIAGYESSTGIQQLALNLASQERNKKQQQRRSLAEGGAGSATSPATGNGPHSGGAAGPSRDPRSGGGQPGKPTKKGAGASSAQQRQLTKKEEIRYGISHHDRLSSGVSFRQSRIEKLVLAKSAAQAQKLHDALGELQIPVRAVMATDKVCTRYENLIRDIHALLDARKTSEKLNNEIKVLTAQKEARERKERGEDEVEGEDADTSRMDMDGTNDEAGTARATGGKTDAEKEEDDENADRSQAEARSDNEDDENDEEAENDGNGEADADAEEDSEGGDNDEEDAEVDAEDDDREDDNENEQSDGSDGEGDVDVEDQDQDENDVEGEDEDEEQDVEADEDDEAEGEEDEADVEGQDDADNEADAEEDAEAEAEADADADAEAGADAEAEAEAPPEPEHEEPENLAVKAHKRSASVLSGASTRSSKRTRR
jgi:DNA methyltransferase 1-associated protein 1